VCWNACEFRSSLHHLTRTSLSWLQPAPYFLFFGWPFQLLSSPSPRWYPVSLSAMPDNIQKKTKASSSPSFFWLLPITTKFSPTVQQLLLRPAKTVSHKQCQELCFSFQTDSSSLSPTPVRSRLQLQQRRRFQLR